MFSNLLDITGFFVSVLINLLLIALICYYFKRKIDNLEFSQSEQAKTLYALLSQQNSPQTSDSGESKNVIMNVNDIMGGLDLTQLVQRDHNDEGIFENQLGDLGSSGDGSGSDSDSDSDTEEDKRQESESEPSRAVIEDIPIVPVEETHSPHSDNITEIGVAESNTIVVENVFHVSGTGERVGAEELEESGGAEKGGDAERVIMEDIETFDENYEKMTVKELKTVLAEKGVHAKSSMNKSDIINILKGASSMNLEEDIMET